MTAHSDTKKVTHSQRTALKERIGQTLQVRAIFERNGFRNSPDKVCRTVLVKNIRECESGEILTGHLWFEMEKPWKKLGLAKGDMVEFTARATEYRKGYWGRKVRPGCPNPPRTDYHLTPPKEIKVVLRSHLRDFRNRGKTAAALPRVLAVA